MTLQNVIIFYPPSPFSVNYTLFQKFNTKLLCFLKTMTLLDKSNQPSFWTSSIDILIIHRSLFLVPLIGILLLLIFNCQWVNDNYKLKINKKHSYYLHTSMYIFSKRCWKQQHQLQQKLFEILVNLGMSKETHFILEIKIDIFLQPAHYLNI